MSNNPYYVQIVENNIDSIIERLDTLMGSTIELSLGALNPGIVKMQKQLEYVRECVLAGRLV